jgi:hypothetical protein
LNSVTRKNERHNMNHLRGEFQPDGAAKVGAADPPEAPAYAQYGYVRSLRCRAHKTNEHRLTALNLLDSGVVLFYPDSIQDSKGSTMKLLHITLGAVSALALTVGVAGAQPAAPMPASSATAAEKKADMADDAQRVAAAKKALAEREAAKNADIAKDAQRVAAQRRALAQREAAKKADMGQDAQRIAAQRKAHAARESAKKTKMASEAAHVGAAKKNLMAKEAAKAADIRSDSAEVAAQKKAAAERNARKAHADHSTPNRPS